MADEKWTQRPYSFEEFLSFDRLKRAVMSRVLDLGSQSPDMHIHSSISTVVVPSPDLIEQGLTSENLSGITCQELKQLELLEGKCYGLTAKRYLTLS